MASQTGGDWLHVFQKERDWFVACGNGLGKAIASFREPRTQSPSSVLLVGTREREDAQRSLLAGVEPTRSRGLAQLYTDISTLDSDHPLLFATLNTATAYSNFQKPRCNFGELGHRVEWLSEHQPKGISTRFVVDKLISRVLLVFTDVVCLFLDDFSTPEEGIELFHRWIEVVNSSRLWRPQVILVSSRKPSNEGMPNALAFGNTWHEELRSKDSHHHRYRALKQTILQSVEVVRKRRIACKRLFSANHLNALFKACLQHTARCALPEFDFITATRQYNKVGDHFIRHLETFLRLCTANDAAKDSVIRYIASALILDSLPPGMHHFDPQETFTSLYYLCCYKAFSSNLNKDESVPDWCQQLEAMYCRFYSELEEKAITASELHLHNLRSLQVDWSAFHSSQVCLFCLFRHPEHPLQCGHACCDVCACIFGTPKQKMEYSYRITQCILCQATANLEARVKPPTAGSRLLVLDGGGVRGLFTLHILDALDKHRRLPYPIYDEFDLALGTSTGGLIVLMFLLRRSISECITIFKRLAGKAFSRRYRFGSSRLARILEFMSSLLTDSTYGATEMEECVREAYGPNELLFGCFGSISCVSGTKIAVTTMAVSDSQLCILSNYNGSGVRQGYKHYRPVRAEDEVLVRDAARATSAAPSYFPAKFVRGLGYMQDGGAGKHNNPIDPAEWELRAIWDTTLDIALSIGTGYAKRPESPKIVSQRLRFRDRFFPRLARLFNAMLSAEGGWSDHMNRIKIDDKHRYYRINIALDQEPLLDDVGQIPEMERQSETFLKAYDFSAITQALFAASFFFELHEKPVTNSRSCTCHGSIRCRSPEIRALVARILEEYPAASFRTEDGTSLGFIHNHPLCRTCDRYCQAVTFKVRHLSQNVSIFLRFNRSSQHRISGFPEAMSRFSKRQLQDAHFGRPDHRRIQDMSAAGCMCTSIPKRKRAKTTGSRTAKRRRLSITVRSR